MKLDLARMSKKVGMNFGQLQQSGANDPSGMLHWLKGSSGAKRVGTETIDGTPSTHYRSTIDLIAAAKKAADPARKGAIERAVKAMGVNSMPVDVWVDRRGRVRRERLGWSQAAKPGSPQPVRMELTTDFVAYGVPMTITTPAGDKVFDATSMAAGALNGTGG
jgi:hypothetical protein